MNFPQENKVFQRPRRSVLLPPYCLATTIVNYYDRSIFSMTGSFGKVLRECRRTFLTLRGHSRDTFWKLRGPEGPGETLFSRSETWVPKRGGLKPAGKRQESATFLQRSFFDVAVQFFACCSAAFGQNDIRIAEKPMLQYNFCSAAFRKLQRNFCFRLWRVAGVGFRGVGFRTC